MTEAQTTSCFSVTSVADAYNDIYVPRIFIPWAELLVEVAAPRPGESLLDVATGPGTVARVAAGRLGPSGRVVGTDLSGAMIELARRQRAPDGAPIEYLVAPADPLPVADASFDIVTCQQGLQFFPDRPAAVSEMFRTLKPGGRLTAAVWRGIDMQPSFAAIYAALKECLPLEKARPYATPFEWPDPRELADMLRQTGFREVVIRERVLPLTYEGGIKQALSTLAASPVATTVAAMTVEDRQRLWATTRRCLLPLEVEGRVRAHMVSNVATARK